MTTNFSPVLGVLCFKPIPKYFNVWYEDEGILRISQWSDTGPSWPSCLKDTFASLVDVQNTRYSGSEKLGPCCILA